MTAESFDASLEIHYYRQPFRPFQVELLSGERFEVDYPRGLNYRNGIASFIKPGGTLVLFDHTTVHHIVDEPAGRRKSKSNGK